MTDTVYQRTSSRLGLNLAAAEFRVRYLRGDVTTESLRRRYESVLDVPHSKKQGRRLDRMSRVIAGTSLHRAQRQLGAAVSVAVLVIGFVFIAAAVPDRDDVVLRILSTVATGMLMWMLVREHYAPSLVIHRAHMADQYLSALEVGRGSIAQTRTEDHAAPDAATAHGLSKPADHLAAE